MKCVNHFFLLIIVATLGLHLAFAADSPDKILAKLQKKYDTINDASTEFTQEVLFGLTKAKHSFKGTMYMKKGNKYRIELEGQTIVTDGKSVWSYSEANKQVLIDKYKEESQTFAPDKILLNIPKHYTPTLIGDEKLGEYETVVLKMIPRDESQHYKWMKLWIDKDEWTMRKIQLLDLSGTMATYTINDLKINTNPSDSAFHYAPPKGVDVIDMR